jgi:hypothetical protein
MHKPCIHAQCSAWVKCRRKLCRKYPGSTEPCKRAIQNINYVLRDCCCRNEYRKDIHWLKKRHMISVPHEKRSQRIPYDFYLFSMVWQDVELTSVQNCWRYGLKKRKSNLALRLVAPEQRNDIACRRMASGYLMRCFSLYMSTQPLIQKQNKLRGLNPRANYAVRAIAASRRS